MALFQKFTHSSSRGTEVLNQSRSSSPGYSDSSASTKTFGRVGTPVITRRRRSLNKTNNSSERAVNPRHRPPLPLRPPTVRAKRTLIRRKRSAIPTRVNPELAALVVKKYLIPLFRPGSSVDPELKEARFFRALQVVNGTVYDELDKSVRVFEQIQQTRRDLEEFKGRLRDAEQEQAIVQSEKLQLEGKLIGVQEVTRCQIEEIGREEGSGQGFEVKNGAVRGQARMYWRMWQEAEAKIEECQESIMEQKAINDKQKNTTMNYEENKKVRTLENELMIEKIREYQQRMNIVSSRKIAEEKLTYEMKKMSLVLYEYATRFNTLDMEHQILTDDRLLLAQDYKEMQILTNESQTLYNKLAKASKDNINRLQRTKNEMFGNKEQLKHGVLEMEHIYKDVYNQLKKIKQKLKQFKLNSRKSDEQICFNCNQGFLENENFNWSCRRHASGYSGKQYWCCGKRGKNAPGCIIGKHEIKEEEEPENPATQNDEYYRNIGHVCSSCKQTGHKLQNCPRDPNIRTTNELFEELERVEDLRGRRIQNMDPLESQAKMMQILAARFGNDAFGIEMVSSVDSDESLDQVSNVEEFRRFHDPFLQISSTRDLGCIQPLKTRVNIPEPTSFTFASEMKMANLQSPQKSRVVEKENDYSPVQPLHLIQENIYEDAYSQKTDGSYGTYDSRTLRGISTTTTSIGLGLQYHIQSLRENG